MIELVNLSTDAPYTIFKELYAESINANQKNIEAICIASYSSSTSEVQARYVNLKKVINREFIFFSNYLSPKAIDFHSHNQVTGVIYWNSINVQIRMKAIIKKTNHEFNQEYFRLRDKRKNALAISSNQSHQIESYEMVLDNYENTLTRDDLQKCPSFWGGFSLTPYYFEFWRGQHSRLNKRDVYELNNMQWNHTFLEP
jgi:pyridoxamine 5'-phosphate oxidase